MMGIIPARSGILTAAHSSAAAAAERITEWILYVLIWRVFWFRKSGSRFPRPAVFPNFQGRPATNPTTEHGLGLKEIQKTIGTIDPLPGAREFLDELRSLTQVIIISDTFTQFAMPLMKKLGYPTLFCNTLEVAPSGEITGFKMRIENSKYSTVRALQSIGFNTIASGDSYNDLAMIRASKAGFLFKSTPQIKADNPDIPAFDEFPDLLAAIKSAL